ncbi:MAG: efflux RND transporter periplasmic adaptor subunit [Acidobacteriota bacterium]
MPKRFALAMIALVLIPAQACAPPAPKGEDPPLPVRTTVLARADFQPTVTLLGTLAAAGRTSVTVTAEGTLSYPARFASGLTTGSLVQKGELLATVDSVTARGRVEEARLGTRGAEEDLARVRRGAELGVLPHADLQHAEVEAEGARLRLANAQAEAARLQIRAPSSGTLIVERVHPPGSEIASGGVLAEIALAGRPRIEAIAAAADRDLLRPGLAVRVLASDGVTLLAGSGSATLTEIAPVVDGGTVRVIAQWSAGGAAASASLPPPGTGVVLEVQRDRRSSVLSVPEESVVTGAGSAAVWVVDPGSDRPRAARRSVELGARGSGKVEVVRGLFPGDRVVISGAAFLQPGAAVVEEKVQAGGAG